MTAIVGFVDKSNSVTYLATDSLGSNRFTGHDFGVKAFISGKVGFAVCGSYRVMNILQFKASPREFQIGETADDYVYKYLSDYLFKLLIDNYAMSVSNNISRLDNASVIIAVHDKLYLWEQDNSVLKPNKHYIAGGSGEYHSESVIQALEENTNLSAKTIIKKAIGITSEYVLSVGGPVNIIEYKHP